MGFPHAPFPENLYRMNEIYILDVFVPVEQEANEEENMKKLFFVFALILTLSLCLCSSASAATLFPMPPEINPEHLEKTACYARITKYDEEKNALIVELMAREVFTYEEMMSLQAGDSIYTGGEEILIHSFTPTDWCSVILINDGDVFFFEAQDGYCRMVDANCYLWNVVAVIECPVKDDLLLLDYVNDNTGDMLDLPIVLTAQELTDKMLAEQASDRYHIGFAADNVSVVFDGEGDLAVIRRFYVPWQ